MSFARGDVVQVIHERSRWYGQVGAVELVCVCPVNAFSVAIFGHQMYQVSIDGGRCFPEHYLRKLGERPAPAAEPTETPIDEPAVVPA